MWWLNVTDKRELKWCCHALEFHLHSFIYIFISIMFIIDDNTINNCIMNKKNKYMVWGFFPFFCLDSLALFYLKATGCSVIWWYLKSKVDCRNVWMTTRWTATTAQPTTVLKLFSAWWWFSTICLKLLLYLLYRGSDSLCLNNYNALKNRTSTLQVLMLMTCNLIQLVKRSEKGRRLVLTCLARLWHHVPWALAISSTWWKGKLTIWWCSNSKHRLAGVHLLRTAKWCQHEISCYGLQLLLSRWSYTWLRQRLWEQKVTPQHGV